MLKDLSFDALVLVGCNSFANLALLKTYAYVLRDPKKLFLTMHNTHMYDPQFATITITHQ